MSELLQELRDKQAEKLALDIEILVEKDDNYGVPRRHAKRTRELVLVARAQEVGLEILGLRAEIVKRGEPLIQLTDVLSNLYAVEALIDLKNPEDAWDALSGILDSLEKEFERVGA